MLRAQSSYKQAPELLAAYAPQYKKQHYHIHGRHLDSEQTFYSLFLQENQLNKAVRKTIKGACIGIVSSAIYNIAFSGQQRQFEHTRRVLARRFTSKSLKGAGVYGAFAGMAWYFIYDVMFCPHGKQASIYKHVGAYALGGGLLFATMYHPSAFGYGIITGAFTGLFFDSLNRTRYPRNFMTYMTNFDKQKRANILRDDQEYQMSIRNVINQNRIFHPI